MDVVAKEVLELIEGYGYEAYLVGGYPRDYLLNNKTDDFDICTSAKKETLEKIFDVVFKDNFGSVILNYKNKTFEITTYRKELSYSEIRTPNAIYTPNLKEDLLRRDFTINTICLNSKGEVVDLLGGINDLKDKTIKCVGKPEQKMSEDPLRILRAIRFACLYGFEISKELELAIKNNNYRVQELSYFRKKQELDKIFSSENLLRGIELLKQFDLCRYLGISIDNVVVTSQLGIWAQIDYSNEYIFNSHETKIINGIREVVSNKEINNYHLYIYNHEIIKVASDILKIDSNDIEERYHKLPIRNRNDINISYEDIVHNTTVKASLVYKDLEEKILEGILENDYTNIVKYIRTKQQ